MLFSLLWQLLLLIAFLFRIFKLHTRHTEIKIVTLTAINIKINRKWNKYKNTTELHEYARQTLCYVIGYRRTGHMPVINNCNE